MEGETNFNIKMQNLWKKIKEMTLFSEKNGHFPGEKWQFLENDVRIFSGILLLPSGQCRDPTKRGPPACWPGKDYQVNPPDDPMAFIKAKAYLGSRTPWPGGR